MQITQTDGCNLDTQSYVATSVHKNHPKQHVVTSKTRTTTSSQANQASSILDKSTPAAAAQYNKVTDLLNEIIDEPDPNKLVAGPGIQKIKNLLTNVVMIIDSMSIRAIGPTDPDTGQEIDTDRKTEYYNTLILINHIGQICWMSHTVLGSNNMDYVKFLKSRPPNFGYLKKIMRDPNTPIKMRPIIIADNSFRAASNAFKGSIICTPIKNKHNYYYLKTGGVTQEELDYNQMINKIRNKAEKVINNLKGYKILSKQHYETPEQFRDQLNTISGLVNFSADWKGAKFENSDFAKQIANWRPKSQSS